MSDELSKVLGKKNIEDLLSKVPDYVGLEMTAHGAWLSVHGIVRSAIFRRPGSDKLPRGWQVTIRDELKDYVRDENRGGYLLFSRGKGYLIPLQDINKFILYCDSGAFNKPTLDIFFSTNEQGSVIIRFHGEEMDISQFALS